MNAIKAVWTQGRILPSEPVNWPEGSELLIEPLPSMERIGLDEADWRDGPAAQADWDAWIRTLEPAQLSAAERESLERFQDEQRRFNLAAVRRQMGLGDGAP